MESTIPNHAERLIEAISNRLRGIVNVLDLLRQQDDTEHQDTLLVLEDAIGDQIDTLENHLLPIVTRRTAPEPPCVGGGAQIPRAVPRG